MGMKILITGCQGFIGKNLAQHLKKQGHYVVGIDKTLKIGDPVYVDEFVGHDMEQRISIENDFKHHKIYRSIDPSISLPFIQPNECNESTNCINIATIEDNSIIELLISSKEFVLSVSE